MDAKSEESVLGHACLGSVSVSPSTGTEVNDVCFVVPRLAVSA